MCSRWRLDARTTIRPEREIRAFGQYKAAHSGPPLDRRVDTMAKLSDTHAILLAAAASRGNLSVLPVPEGLKAKGASLHRLLQTLVRRGWVAETVTDAFDETWTRSDDSDGAKGAGLVITPAGLAAIGVQAPAQSDPGEAASSEARSQPDAAGPAIGPASAAPRPGGKLGAVMDAIARPNGASLDELVAMSGWLPHTTRAAVTRLRQRGHDVTLRTVDGRTAYCLAWQA